MKLNPKSSEVPIDNKKSNRKSIEREGDGDLKM
jgi:hypothetical protein